MRKLWNSIELFSHRRSSSFTLSLLSRSYCADHGVFDEGEHVLASLKIDLEGENPKKAKALSFPDRALKAFENDPNKRSCLSLLSMGSLLPNKRFTCCLKGFSDSLGYLDWDHWVSGRVLEVFSAENADWARVSVAERKIFIANRVKLTKTWLNVRNSLVIKDVNFSKNTQKVLKNLRKSLEIKEMAYSAELGKAHHDLAQAYAAVSDFEGALPNCLKALQIHKKHLGWNSVEVAYDRKLLAIVYSRQEKHDKALEHNVLAQEILKNWNLNSDLLQVKIDAAHIMIALGRHDEAVDTLQNVMQQTDKDSEAWALALISMAKALSNQEKFSECKRCLGISLGILDKREKITPVEVAEAYTDISVQYETMNEFESAISLLKRALALLERHPQEQHSQGRVSARIGWLLLLIGRVHSAVFYLEGAVERLHFGLSHVYNNLGVAYLELDRPQLAEEMFEEARFCKSDPDKIEAWMNLSMAEAGMGKYSLAIEDLKHIIETWKYFGASAEDELKYACQLLEQLEEKTNHGASANANELPMKALLLTPNTCSFRISLPDCLQNPE